MNESRLFTVQVNMEEIENYFQSGKIKELKTYQLTDAIFYSVEMGVTEAVRMSCVYKINPDNDLNLTRFFKSLYTLDADLFYHRNMTKRIESDEYYHSLAQDNPDKISSRVRKTFKYRGHSFMLDLFDNTVYMTVNVDTVSTMSNTTQNINETRRREIFHKLDAISESKEIAGTIEDIVLSSKNSM